MVSFASLRASADDDQVAVRVQQAIKRPATSEMTNQEILSLTIIIYIVSLIGEYCDFDKLRSTNESK